MKDDEKKFFRTCFKYISRVVYDRTIIGQFKPRDLLRIINEWLPEKRGLYYLGKWSKLGFYDYGVTIDLGWIYVDKIPDRYKELLK